MTGRRDRQPSTGKLFTHPQRGDSIGDVSSVQDGKYGWNVRLVGHDFEYEVTTVDTDHGPEITHLWIKGSPDRPITGDDLRRIPVRRLANAAGRLFDNFNAIGEGNPNQWAQPERAQQNRPRQYGDDHYREIAELAREAVRKGVPVRDSIAAAKVVSPYTVDKWLRECRKRGYLKRDELLRRKNKTATITGEKSE